MNEQSQINVSEVLERYNEARRKETKRYVKSWLMFSPFCKYCRAGGLHTKSQHSAAIKQQRKKGAQ